MLYLGCTLWLPDAFASCDIDDLSPQADKYVPLVGFDGLNVDPLVASNHSTNVESVATIGIVGDGVIVGVGDITGDALTDGVIVFVGVTVGVFVFVGVFVGAQYVNSSGQTVEAQYVPSSGVTNPIGYVVVDPSAAFKVAVTTTGNTSVVTGANATIVGTNVAQTSYTAGSSTTGDSVAAIVLPANGLGNATTLPYRVVAVVPDTAYVSGGVTLYSEVLVKVNNPQLTALTGTDYTA